MKAQRINMPTGGTECPVPSTRPDRILLGHGGGGALTHDLFRSVFEAPFSNEFLRPLLDGAIIPLDGSRLAFSTDSYVVHPLFFPGGSIGDLAVNGTVNDLAMCGADPLFLSAAFVLEEGMELETLRRVVSNMREATARAGVQIVTGDTKVVERGKADGMFITTAGIGIIPDGVDLHPRRVRPGDRVLLSGSIARHGIAVLSVRDGLSFEGAVASDTAPLNGLVRSMLKAGPGIRVLRDPTRGGIATTLLEIARSAGAGITIEESALCVEEPVAAACEILGLDPLYVANEGVLIALVSAEDAGDVLEAMRAHPLGRNAVMIGRAHADHPGTLSMKTVVGTTRVVNMLSGEQPPRIC